MRKKQKNICYGKLVDYVDHNINENYEAYAAYWATGGNGSADCYYD